jgi:hypothetical protein
MIEKSYQYLCLKLCNRIRSWLFNTACNLLQKEKESIQMIDINLSVDVLNVMTLKHFPVKNIRVFTSPTSSVNIFRDKCIQYFQMNELSSQLIQEKPDIIMMSFSLNSLEMNLHEFNDMCRYIIHSGAICIGTMYNKENLEKFVGNETNKMLKAEPLGNDMYDLIFTYNLYGGMAIQNRVKVYTSEYIRDIVQSIDPRLSIEFTNFLDSGIIEKETMSCIKESLNIRTCFIIRKL